MPSENDLLRVDLEQIGRISFLPVLLQVVCKTTGLGFAAVARVTPERWIACRVRDEIQFGLASGGELPVATTLCNEVRETGNAVVIDHVAHDEVYCNHHTPAMYGLQSYISVPISHGDGAFFGTLCAIDPRPASLNTPGIVGMFKTFAELVSIRLDVARRLPAVDVVTLDSKLGADLEALLASLADERGPIREEKFVQKVERPLASIRAFMVGYQQVTV